MLQADKFKLTNDIIENLLTDITVNAKFKRVKLNVYIR